MIARPRVSWVVPVTLGALLVALIAAVIVARSQRPSQALVAATPGILNADQGAAPEIAAINSQLAQIASLRAHALYGPGLTHVVRAPVASLRPLLGEEWRELGHAVGRAYVRPTGVPSRYLEVGVVVAAQHGPARLELLTSEGERLVQPVGTRPFQLINVGPLLAPKRGGIGLALTTLQPNGTSPGPNLVLSPIQAQYRAPGQWVTGMPALAEVGPGGRRGVYLKDGSTTQIAITPGLSGRCNLSIQATGVGGSATVTVSDRGETRSVRVSSTPGVIPIGSFSRPAAVVSLSVKMSPAKSNAGLFVSNLQFSPTTP